jgi:hypothetical protein
MASHKACRFLLGRQLLMLQTITAATISTTAAAGAHPVIYEVSGPTEPGSTLLISGSGLGNVSTVTVCDVSSTSLSAATPCAVLAPEQPWDLSLKATLPGATRAFVGNVTITAVGGGATSVLINEPRVHWRLASPSEAEGAAHPGGELRLFGESLAWDVAAANCPSAGSSTTAATATVTLVSTSAGGQRTLQLKPSFASCYRLDLLLPSHLPLGSVDIWINNGLWTGNASSRGMLAQSGVPITAAPVWPNASWTLGEHCISLSDCLGAAWAAEGGVVIIPAGQHVMLRDGEVVVLGPRVRLVGGGPGATLTWANNSAGPRNASYPNGWVTGPGPWQLRGMTLLLPSGMGGASAIHIPPGSLGCLVDSVTVHSWGPHLGAGVGIGFVKAPADDGAVGTDVSGRRPRRLNGRHKTAAGTQRLRVEQPNNAPVARHWSVTGSIFVQHEGSNATTACDAYWPHSDGFWMLAAADGRLQGNSFTTVCEGYNAEISSRLFFADNVIVAVGSMYSEGNGFSHFSWPQVSEHIYVGNTTQVGNPAASVRQETMSFDGDGSLYYGPVTSVDGNKVRVPSDPVQPNQNYTGLLFHVAAGSGVGQTRRVVAWQGTDQKHKHIVFSTWMLDSSLDTELDNTSFISIGAYCGRITFDGNHYLNGTQFQLFGTAVNVVVAGNSFSNVSSDGEYNHGNCWTGLGCGGLIAWGFSGGNYPCHHDSHGHFPCAPISWSIEPNYYIHILNNTFHCSLQSASTGPDFQAPPPGTIGPRAFGHVHRGNALAGDTSLVVTDVTWSVIVEANRFSPAQCFTGLRPSGQLLVNATDTRAVWVSSDEPTPRPPPPPSPSPPTPQHIQFVHL